MPATRVGLSPISVFKFTKCVDFRGFALIPAESMFAPRPTPCHSVPAASLSVWSFVWDFRNIFWLCWPSSSPLSSLCSCPLVCPLHHSQASSWIYVPLYYIVYLCLYPFLVVSSVWSSCDRTSLCFLSRDHTRWLTVPTNSDLVSPELGVRPKRIQSCFFRALSAP